MIGRGGVDRFAEEANGGLDELDVSGPYVVVVQGGPAVVGVCGAVGGRTGAGQVGSYGLGDQVGCYRQQHNRPFQAGLQIVLVLPFGKELVASPVHRNQHT